MGNKTSNDYSFCGDGHLGYPHILLTALFLVFGVLFLNVYWERDARDWAGYSGCPHLCEKHGNDDEFKPRVLWP
ncbi:hypothetical protein D3C77_461390 [compost metagenome]